MTEIRFATPDDAEELLAIYAPYVERTAITFEYTVPGVEEFRARIEAVQASYPYLCAVRDGKIVGYAYASAFHSRAAYSHSAEVSIYLAMSERRQGLGRLLYGHLEALMARQNIYHSDACIAVPDADDEYLDGSSPAFHAKMGYRTVARHEHCGYKFDRWYNMIWMEKDLVPLPAHPEPFISFPALGISEP